MGSIDTNSNSVLALFVASQDWVQYLLYLWIIQHQMENCKQFFIFKVPFRLIMISYFPSHLKIKANMVIILKYLHTPLLLNALHVIMMIIFLGVMRLMKD